METVYYDSKGRKLLSLSAIAKRLGASVWAVSLALDRLGIESVVRGRLRLVRMTDVKKIVIDPKRQERAREGREKGAPAN